jgi:DNA-binding NtrC family response regulator
MNVFATSDSGEVRVGPPPAAGRRPAAAPGPATRRAPVVVLDFAREDRFGELVGASVAMRAVFDKLRRAARHELTVLLRGESGTGKELAARALHTHSARAAGPFVVFDCAAVSPQLVESELFGVARGAFTGAERARDGVACAAHGGTLFLDEIGELPLELQPKLLRLLDRHELRRVGEADWRRIDVRIVAATHRDLTAEVAAGRFRADLFHRLAVAEIGLPALRERRGDIPLLVRHLLAEEPSWRGELLPAALVRLMEAHEWPGNVRELRNVVLRWLYVANTGVDLEALVRTRVATPLAGPAAAPTPAAGAPTTSGRAAPRPARPPAAAAPLSGAFPGEVIDPDVPLADLRDRLQRWFEPRWLMALLQTSGGNVSMAARRADVARKTLYEMMHRHGVDRRGRKLQ